MIASEKTVVEYPTLFFGLPETTSTLNTLVSEHRRSNDVNEIPLPDTVVGLEDQGAGEQDLVEEPGRKKLRGIDMDIDIGMGVGRMEEDFSVPQVSTIMEDQKLKWTPGSSS